ncbi:MAG TPA: hypothetical protein VHX60_08905 [Acidobacteriaceae bacterium]|nr:hypothetical protein [Acidobacteriaceae bacterium]
MTFGISGIQVKRNFYWIWFVGAGAWFFDAAFSLHHHSVRWGLLEAAVSATFLAVGMYLKKQGSRN